MTTKEATSGMMIHVADSEQATSANRPKRTGKQTDSARKRRRSSKIANQPPLNESFTTHPASTTGDELSSYRHLFSFGAKSNEQNAQESVIVTPNKFTLLGGVSNETDNKATGKDTPTIFQEEEDDQHQSIVDDPMQIEDDVEQEFGDVHTPYVTTAHKSFEQDKSRNEIGVSPGGVNIVAGQDMQYQDDFVFSRENLLALSMNFCRNENIETLEEQWCAPNGIREQMRTDFRLKRQNVARGRKLGTNTKLASKQ